MELWTDRDEKKENMEYLKKECRRTRILLFRWSDWPGNHGVTHCNCWMGRPTVNDQLNNRLLNGSELGCYFL